jgi:hypothetical protein
MARRTVLPVLLALLLAVVAGAPAASAAPVQQFAIQLKNLKADGSYTVVYTSNAFDSSGGPPPPLEDASMRLPRGMGIKREFLRPDRLCDIAKFAGFLFQNRPKDVTYAQMVDDVPRGKRRLVGKLTPTAKRIVKACLGAYLGSGETVVDARPLYPALIPAKFSLFLTPPSDKRAIAGVGILTHYDRSSPIAVNEPRYVLLQPIFRLNMYDDPTPDGKYGYRIKLITEKTSGLRLSIAELRVEVPGIFGPTARSRREFWATPPRCPGSGQVPFRADYQYRGGERTRTEIRVPCPRFRR